MAVPTDPDVSRLRLTVIMVVVGCLFVALFARLWYLQVINATTAQATATSQGVRTITIPAARGLILDRNGNVLVGNRTSEVIEITDRQRALNDPAMLTRLAAMIGQTVKQLKAAVNNVQYSPYAPVPVLPDAPASDILFIQEHQSLFPGVSATTETIRDYTPAGTAAANIVGYVGQLTAAQYQKVKGLGYYPGEQIGLAGVEAEYNSVLRGTPGVERVQVDSQGNVLGVLSSTPPVQGANLVLTIDGSVQMTAVSAIEQGLATARTQIYPGTGQNYKAPAGSAVVEDPKNGTVVALATYPDYNPAQFVGGISSANYKALQNPAAHNPLLDRAIQGLYAPGSTFKLATATAGLEQGIITPTSVYHDVGHITVGGQTFTNDGGTAYGNIQLPYAITVSSDNFFNNIGMQQWNQRATLGVNAEQNVAKAYGFGAPTGIKLPYESAGLVPTPASVAATYKKYPKLFATGNWSTGDSMQVAIGQFEDLVTPMQLANAYATFANGGTRYTPRLVASAVSQSGHVTPYASKVVTTVPLKAPWRAAILAGFRGVIQNPNGTAYAVFQNTPLAKMDLAGKTGSAQRGKNAQGVSRQVTSVFTSFGPASNPRYVVDAIIEKAGYGSAIAAPVVRQIWDKLYNLPLQHA